MYSRTRSSFRKKLFLPRADRARSTPRLALRGSLRSKIHFVTPLILTVNQLPVPLINGSGYTEYDLSIVGRLIKRLREGHSSSNVHTSGL